MVHDGPWSIRQFKAGKREGEGGNLKILSYPNCTLYMTPLSKPHPDRTVTCSSSRCKDISYYHQETSSSEEEFSKGW